MTRVRSTFADNGPFAMVMYHLGRTLLVGFCRVYMRMSVEGREHVPATGPFIVAPVHRSYLDTPIAAVVTKRRMRFMGKDSMWQSPFKAWLLSSVGGFPVSRGTADREALRRSIQVLEGGEPLVVFPEGERKSGPIVQPLFGGAAYVATKAQVPILPVGIGGSERVMPKGAKMIWPRKVHVVIGPPLTPPPPTAAGRLDRKAMDDFSDVLHDRLQELFDSAQIRAGA